MTETASTTTKRAPISERFSSPTITVHLVKVQPNSDGEAKSETGPTTSVGNAGESSVMKALGLLPPDSKTKPPVNQRPGKGSDSIIASYHLHTSVLTANSEYFKGIFAFDGAEVSENCVYLETPVPFGMEIQISKVAFSWFIDYLYTNSIDVSLYNLEPADTDVFVYLAALYVLGEKLVAEGLKKYVLKRMRETLLAVARLFTPGGDCIDYNWRNLLAAIEIVFSGTVRKEGTGVGAVPEEKVWETAAKLYESKERAEWLGKEPMRKLLAAFLATVWCPYDDSTGSKEFKEGHFAIRRKIVEGYPELNELLLIYLVSRAKLVDVPLPEVGLEEVEGSG